MSDILFKAEYKIYHDDVDYTGIMYNANYVKYMEHARSDWLESLGFDQREMIESNVMFVVCSVNLTYLRPARFCDKVYVTIQLSEISKVSMLLQQTMYLKKDDTELCRGHVKLACVNSQLKPCYFPKKFLEINYGR